MTDKNTIVIICGKCGRGIIGAESKDSIIDSQPVWWTQTEEGPRCNGRLIRILRDNAITLAWKDEVDAK